MTDSLCPVCSGLRVRPFMEVEGRFYWQCEDDCRAVWLEPSQRLDPESESAHYRLHDNDVHDVAYRRFLSALSIPLLGKLPSAQEGLDYGCGPGPALAVMLEEAGHAMAVYDPFFANDPAVLGRQYDFISCTEVAEHFHQPAAEFSRLDGLLKPGGWLGIMTGMLADTMDFPGWHYRRDPTHVVFYRKRTFEVLARQYGWYCEFPCRDVVLMKKPA